MVRLNTLMALTGLTLREQTTGCQVMAEMLYRVRMVAEARGEMLIAEEMRLAEREGMARVPVAEE